MPGKNVSELNRFFWIVAAVVTVGFASTVATALAMISTKLMILIFVAVMGSGLLYLSGNTRLFVFYAVIFLAPWTITKNFMFKGHMAGASSFDLHISDPFLIALICYQIRDRITGRALPFRFPAYLWFWVALILLGLWSSIFNQMPLPPAHEVYRMTRWLLWMVVLINEVVRHKMFLHAAYALLIAALAQVGFAYLEVAGINVGMENYGQMTEQNLENLGSSTLAGVRGVHRIGGIMIHPNVLGAYLAMSSSIALALLFSKVSSFVKTLVAALLINFVIIIVMTLSRASWIDFSIVLVGVTLITFTNPYSRIRHTLIRTLILGGIFIVGLAFSGQIVKRLTQSAPEALIARWDFVDASMKMIADRPFFGVGLNNFTFYQPPYTKQGSINKLVAEYGDPDDWPVVHNSYLLVWVEQGTIGLIIWLSFHICIIKTAVGNLRLRDPTLHALNVGLMVAHFAIMVDSLVSFFDRLQQGVVIWTFASLIFALNYWRREHEGINQLDHEIPISKLTENKPGHDKKRNRNGWLKNKTGHPIRQCDSG